MSFLDGVTASVEIKMGLKVQVLERAATGKSHDGYETLRRPLVVVDADVASGLFVDGRFPSFTRLGPDQIPGLPQLVAFFEEFCTDARWFVNYRSLMVDSLTALVDLTIAALGLDNSSDARGRRNASDQLRAQSDWARLTKALMRWVRRASTLGVHVYITAEERTRVGPGQSGSDARSSLSDRKFMPGFDLILQKLSRDKVLIHKSRHHSLEIGKTISGYDAKHVLGPLLT